MDQFVGSGGRPADAPRRGKHASPYPPRQGDAPRRVSPPSPQRAAENPPAAYVGGHRFDAKASALDEVLRAQRFASKSPQNNSSSPSDGFDDGGAPPLRPRGKHVRLDGPQKAWQEDRQEVRQEAWQSVRTRPQTAQGQAERKKRAAHAKKPSQQAVLDDRRESERLQTPSEGHVAKTMVIDLSAGRRRPSAQRESAQGFDRANVSDFPASLEMPEAVAERAKEVWKAKGSPRKALQFEDEDFAVSRRREKGLSSETDSFEASNVRPFPVRGRHSKPSEEEPARLTEEKAADEGQAEEKTADEGRVKRKPAAGGGASLRGRGVKRRRPRKGISRIAEKKGVAVALAAIGLTLAVLALFVGIGGLFRWVFQQDAQNMQGQWRANDSQAIIVIDDSHIKLAGDVSYEYTIDTTTKTLSFSFGQMSGNGRYRFSADKQTLYLMDGGDNTWLSTLLSDWKLNIGRFFGSFTGQNPEDQLVEQGAAKLVKVSDDASAEPSTPKASEREDASWDLKYGTATSDIPSVRDLEKQKEQKEREQREEEKKRYLESRGQEYTDTSDDHSSQDDNTGDSYGDEAWY